MSARAQIIAAGSTSSLAKRVTFFGSRCACAVHANEQVLLADAELGADRRRRPFLDDAQHDRVAQRRRQPLDAIERVGELFAPRGDLCGAGAVARDVVAGALVVVAVVERDVVRVAAQDIDDLVLEDRRQPRAQRGAAAEASAAGEDRFDDVVHRVLGESRIAELAQREADEVGPVRDDLGDRDGQARRGGGGGVQHGGQREASMAATVGAADRSSVRKDHATITLL